MNTTSCLQIKVDEIDTFLGNTQPAKNHKRRNNLRSTFIKEIK